MSLATLTPMTLLEEKFGDWKPVSRGARIGWLCFYTLFLLYAFTDRSGFLILDYVNLIIHEGGHFFFSWFGSTITILGGTLGELLVPLFCAIYFFWQREATGFAFSFFWFFENFPYIGGYMADARSAALPLVGAEESDWSHPFRPVGPPRPGPENRRVHAHPRLARNARNHRLAGLPYPSRLRVKSMT